MPYKPPSGFYDQPFYYIFDGSSLTDGRDALNLAVPIIGGLGDFVMRRAVGWGNLVSASSTPQGAYLLRDRSKYPLSHGPIFVTHQTSPPNDDNLFPREQLYPEQSIISFDLMNILRTTPLPTAQIAFMGIRRQHGQLPNIRAPYRYTNRAFSYVQSIVMTYASSANQMATPLFMPISDYDFELLEIRITYQQTAQLFVNRAFTGVHMMLLTAVTPGAQGNNITFTIVAPVGNNLPIVITVVGNAITLTPATDGGGFTTTTPAQAAAALNANPQVAALITAVDNSGGSVTPIIPMLPTTQNLVGGGRTSGLPQVITQIQLYDSVRVTTSNIPFNDIFLNRSFAAPSPPPPAPYQNGAIVPPLLYPVSTQIRMDFYPQFSNSSGVLLPLLITVEFVGRNRIPC
jgi:hypothetical protein